MSANERKLVLVGDSLFAEIAHEYFEHDSDYSVVAFSVESDYLKRNEFRGLPVVPFESLSERFDPADHHVYVATTYGQLNRLRTRLSREAKEQGFELASYVSSCAFIWRNVELGEHCFIFEDNTVQPFVHIGDNTILWSGNHIGHHSRIGNNCFISSHVVISGSVQVGENSFLGVNTTIVNDIAIGQDCWIGPSVTLVKDVDDRTFWAPARSELKDRDPVEFFGVEA